MAEDEYNWEVDYRLLDEDLTETMLVFQQKTIERVVEEAHYSLGHSKSRYLIVAVRVL